jgi:hypothetical protein
MRPLKHVVKIVDLSGNHQLTLTSPPTMAKDFRCPYCAQKVLTATGIKRHISNTPACTKKWAEEIGAITVTTQEADIPPAMPEFEPAAAEDDDDEPMDSPTERADNFIPPSRVESPPPPEPVPRSRRTTVEEVPDVDDPQNFRRFVEPFPGKAGTPLEDQDGEILHGETLFERMRTKQELSGDSKFAPFIDGDEWDLARWLSKNVNQTATDEYLKLSIVSMPIEELKDVLLTILPRPKRPSYPSTTAARSSKRSMPFPRGQIGRAISLLWLGTVSTRMMR